MLPALYFLFYLGAAFALPCWRVWRRSGHNPYVLPDTDDASGFVARGFRVLLMALAAYLAVQWHGGPLAIDLPAFPRTAWCLLGAALAWTVLAQYQMGLSWRIGIDEAQPSMLVTGGLFAWSRNPIFLALRVSLFALLLLLPGAPTLALWLAGELLMQFQVRLEEAFLAGRHGEAYAAYRARVPRWL